MRCLIVLLLIATVTVFASPVQRWQEEIHIPVEVIEIPEPIVYVAPIQSLSTIESIQGVEEPEPIAISNEIVVPLDNESRNDVDLKPVVKKVKEGPAKKEIEKEIKEEVIKKFDEEAKKDEAFENKIEEENQRKDDQLQVETVQDEQYVKKILPTPDNIKPVPDIPQEIEGEISPEVKKLSPAEIDVNVAPDHDNNGLRQGSTPEGLPATTKPPPPNILQQLFQNPIQSIQNAFTGQQSTPVAADENAGSTQPPNLFQQGISSVQQGLQGIQQGFQGFQNQVASALNLPTVQNDTPASDQSTTARPPFNPLQSIQTAFTNIGQTLTGQPAANQQPQQEGQPQQPTASQGPLSGILNLFSPTRPPTTLTPPPAAAQLTGNTAAPSPEPPRDEVTYDSVENSDEAISVVRETDSLQKEQNDKEEKKSK